MAISKTKYKAPEAEIRELFSHHKVGNVQKIAPLGTGDNLIVLGDEFQGIALIKETGLLGLINSAKESME